MNFAVVSRPCVALRLVARGGFRLLRGTARLVLVGFVAIGYLSQLVWIASL